MKKFAFLPAILLASLISTNTMAGSKPSPGLSSVTAFNELVRLFTMEPDEISNYKVEDGITSFDVTTENGSTLLVVLQGNVVTITLNGVSSTYSLEELSE